MRSGAVVGTLRTHECRFMDPRERLIEEWKTVEILVAKTCRARGLSETDTDIVATMVMLKLFENDCAVVRRFRAERNAKFSTYLGRIVLNTFGDFCTKRLGKWHASAAATRLGPIALELERLVYREQCPKDEAIDRLLAAHPQVTREELTAVLGDLRPRPRRQTAVSLETITTEIPDTQQADVLVDENERRKLTQRTADIVRNFLTRLSDNDRVMLQYLFESDMQISTIARILRVPGKQLYRRRDHLLQELRKEMMAAGLTVEEMRSLIGQLSEDANFGLRKDEKRPTEKEEGVTAHPEIPR